jgi:hypothetical protein
MKTILLFFATCLIVSRTLSQENDSTLSKIVKDTLFTTSGYKIVIGEKVSIGTGSTPDGDFKFIRRNSTGFGTAMLMTDNNSYNKSQLSLPRNMSGYKAEVVKFVIRGSRKIGFRHEPLVTLGSGRYEIDVENAIASGELVVPDEFKPKAKSSTSGEPKQQLSVADELAKLKKLYDDGVLTKEEYEALKKKLLEKY